VAQKYELAPQQFSNWKREFLNGAEELFQKGCRNKKDPAEKDQLLKTIGRLKVEVDFLKRRLALEPRAKRCSMIRTRLEPEGSMRTSRHTPFRNLLQAQTGVGSEPQDADG